MTRFPAAAVSYAGPEEGERGLNPQKTKLELGCGERPTPGYIANDINAFPGVEIVGNPWEIKLESDSSTR